MIDYIKDAWKVSGSLKKSEYLTLPSILWSAFEVFILVGCFQIMLKTPAISFGYVIEQVFEVILMMILTVAIWYINIRFNPFAFRSMRMSFKDAVNDAIKTGKKAYSSTSNEAPRYHEERQNPLSNADYIGSVNVQSGKISIKQNKSYRKESNFEHKSRAISDGVAAGSGQFAINTIFMNVYRLFLWPISVFWALFSMRPYVRAYRNSQN